MSGAPPPNIPPGLCDESRKVIPYAVNSTLVGLGLVVVVFRCFSRITTQKGLKADDWTMVAATVIGLANYGLGTANVVYGVGKHIFCIELSSLIKALRLLFVTEILTFVAIFFVKLSVTLFLLRIGLRKWIRWALVTNIVFLGLSTIAFLVIWFVQCRPIQGNWDPAVKATATCLSPDTQVNISYITAAISVATDFGCVFLPLPIIWELKMARRVKYSVVAILSLGVFAMVCGIVRATQVSNLRDNEDITWAVIPIGVWTTAELYVGVIAGSIPSCRHLFLRLVAKIRKRPPPATENTLGVPAHGSGRSYMLQSFSRVRRLFKGSQRSPPDSFRLPDHENGDASYWEHARKNGDRGSEESGLPLYPSLDKNGGRTGGITKTINVQLQHEERKSNGD